MSMIHAKLCQPRIFPENGSRTPEQIDRAQNIGGDLALTQEKLYEIGRDGKLGVRKQTPTLSYPMTQFEYGSMSFWYALANVSDPASAGEDNYIDLDDIKSTTFDITAYLTDDDNTFVGTIWFPKLRVNGFSLNIGDPDAIVMREFDLVGEDFKILKAKYFAYETATCVGDGTKSVVLDPAPVQWASGDYVFKVIRVRSGVATELLEDTSSAYDDNTWRWDAGTSSVIVQDCLTGDVIKVFYPASTAYTTLWTDNDSDPDALFANCCEIYLKAGSSTRIHKLQSVGIDVSFDRTDYKEIGSEDVVQRGVGSRTVTVNLDRYNEGFSLETILADDTAYPYINPRDFVDDIQLMVKIYTDSTHTTFSMGYLIQNLSPTGLSTTQDVEAYNKATNTLESDNIKISDDESEIAFS